MKNSLLFDFTVDKSTNTVFVKKNLLPNWFWFGTHLLKRKFLTNGGHQNPGFPKQSIWTLKLADGDFMQW